MNDELNNKRPTYFVHSKFDGQKQQYRNAEPLTIVSNAIGKARVRLFRAGVEFNEQPSKMYWFLDTNGDISLACGDGPEDIVTVEIFHYDAGNDCYEKATTLEDRAVFAELTGGPLL